MDENSSDPDADPPLGPEFIEFFIEKLPGHSRLRINTGCTFCAGPGGSPDGFYGYLGDYTAPVNLRMELEVIDAGLQQKTCWQWYLNDVKRRDSCDSGSLPGRGMTSGTSVAVGGEVDYYTNDMGVHYFNHVHVKRSDYVNPSYPLLSFPWRYFSPDHDRFWLPVHGGRFGTYFTTASMRSYGPSMNIVSDTHVNLIDDYCSGNRDTPTPIPTHTPTP